MENIKLNVEDFWEIVFYMQMIWFLISFMTLVYEDYMNDYISEKEDEYFNGDDE